MHLNAVGEWLEKHDDYELKVDENGFLCFEDPNYEEPANYAGIPFARKGYISFPIETRILQKPVRERYEIAQRLKDEFFARSGGYRDDMRMVVLCDQFQVDTTRKKKIKNIYNPDERFFDQDNHQIIIYPADSRKLKRGIVPGFLPI